MSFRCWTVARATTQGRVVAMTPAQTAAILRRHAPELAVGYDSRGGLVMRWSCKDGCGAWKCPSYRQALVVYEERKRRAFTAPGDSSGGVPSAPSRAGLPLAA